MFGIIRPCQHRLSAALHTDWIAHLCGLCLALRDEHGQLARTATNYDGLVISALVEAQSIQPSTRRNAGPCPLRGMRRAAVTEGTGAQLAATVSLLLASAKLRDHVEDADGVFGRVPVRNVARTVATRWSRQSDISGTYVGFSTTALAEAVDRQVSVEGSLSLGDSVLLATEPTECATSAAFAHTAVLAGRTDNSEPLSEAGRLFGRIAHLLDAVEDLEQDTELGRWNPLTATGTSLTETRRLCDDAVHGVRLALREAKFTDSTLVHALLVHELGHAVQRTFGHASRPCGPQESPAPSGLRAESHPQDGDGGACWLPKFRVPAKKRGALMGCAVATYMCCSCQFCCRDPFPGPWSGKPHSGGCDCDCSCCECCTCCDC